MNSYKVLLAIFITFIFSSNVFATTQEPDLLVIGNDTVYLRTFPLETIRLEHRVFSRDLVSSNCWRGYRAVWRIENDSLFLEKILACYYINPKQKNIKEFFRENKLEFKEKGEMIFADWFTMDLYRMTVEIAYNSDELFLYDGWGNKEFELLLQIEKGVIIKNEITE